MGRRYGKCGKFEWNENVEAKWREIKRGGRPTGRLPTAALKKGVLLTVWMPDHHGEREANPCPLCKALRVGWTSHSLIDLSHHCKVKKYRTTLLYTRLHTHT